MGTKQEIIEDAVEIVEEQVDVVEKTASLLTRLVWRNHKTHIITTAVVFGVGGAVAGFKWADKKLAVQYQEMLDRDIQSSRDFYKSLYKDKTPEQMLLERHGEVVDIEVTSLASQAGEAAASYAGQDGETPEDGGVEEPMTDEEQQLFAKHGVDPRPPVEQAIQETRQQNIFDTTGEFNYDVEIPLRTVAAPYIITFEEYYGDEKNYEQSDLTYYEEDGVLCLANDEIFEGGEEIVGEDHLTGKWGYGSKDPNVIFVRNDKVEAEFEITRSHGSYRKEVAGFGIDTKDEEGGIAPMKHSAVPAAQRRFRD